MLLEHEGAPGICSDCQPPRTPSTRRRRRGHPTAIPEDFTAGQFLEVSTQELWWSDVPFRFPLIFPARSVIHFPTLPPLHFAFRVVLNQTLEDQAAKNGHLAINTGDHRFGGLLPPGPCERSCYGSFKHMKDPAAASGRGPSLQEKSVDKRKKKRKQDTISQSQELVYTKQVLVGVRWKLVC